MKVVGLPCQKWIHSETWCMLQTTWKVGLILEGHHMLHSISPLQVFLGASQLVGYSVLLQSLTASYCHLLMVLYFQVQQPQFSIFSLQKVCPYDVAMSLGFPMCLVITLQCLNVRGGKWKRGRRRRMCCMLSAGLCLPAYVLSETLGGGTSL